MRKISIFAALVVAMTAVSCVEDINNGAPVVNDGAMTFEASFGAMSKAVLEPGATESKVSWEAGDKVGVLVGEGNYLYTAAAAGYSTTLSTEAAGVPAEGTYYAVYPYDADATLADGVITTSLPAEQTAVLGSFATHLAVAQTTSSQLAFKNVCGLVKVTVDAENVTKIVFEGNSGEVVAGGINVTVSDAPSWTAVAEQGATSVTLAPAEGTLAKGAYYFAVLPQTFAAGFKVTAYKGADASVIRNVASEYTLERADIVGGKAFGIEGAGTEASPYILKTAQDMVDMRSLAKVGGETWFKMANDIDLADVNWIPVNYDQSFNRKIHFDGGNFTISNLTSDKNEHDADYPSLMGVVYGSVKNLKVDKAVIKSTSGCGVIGGYVGTSGKDGLVENVTVTNSSVTNSGDRAGGICGTARQATFKNVSFQGTVTSTCVGAAKSGGFAGQTQTNATFENCDVDVTLSGAGQDIGGFVGFLQDVNTFTGCTAKVVVTSSYAGNARCGGFVGWNSSTKTMITNCQVLDGSTLTNAATLSKTAETTLGGFIGYGDAKDMNTVLTITGCSADVDVNPGSYGTKNSCFIAQLGYPSTVTITNSSAKGKVEGAQNYFGGLIGFMGSTSNVTITGSHFSGNVKGASGVGGLVGGVEATAVLKVLESYATGTIANTANNCGGLVGLVSSSLELSDSYFSGQVNPANYGGGVVGGVATTVTKCDIKRTYSEGTLTATGNYCGGIIGATMGAASGQVVTDCWSSMDVTNNGQQCGGIVGTTTTGMTLRNCFSTGNIESKKSGSAGIIGRIQKSSTVSGCIAWNEKVICGRTANNVYAPGAIAGCAQANGTYEKCWRRADMTLTDPFVTLWDQPDYVNAMPPLPGYSTETHQQAYHGKAAAADATISSVAKTIGWDETVWDLSKEVPTLK